MKIIFTESFENENFKKLGISKKDVIHTIENPIKKQVLVFDDLKLVFFIGQKEKDSLYLIVMGQQKNSTINIYKNCYKIRPDLIHRVGTNEPITLLQHLAENFGLPIKIGEREEKFFLREEIQVTKDIKPSEVIKFEIPPKTTVFTSFFVKMTKDGVAHITLLYSINIDSYLSWLNGTKEIQVNSKTYEVFIAYKRNTSKDFALHLKSVLTESGFPTFLDLTDIPQEFQGKTAWFDVRDSAILNSKRFLIILTAGIELSTEVAKELFLARKVNGMKFIYLRHEDLDPQITIEHKGEKINLADGNQVEFRDNVFDLARKTLQVLKLKK